MTTSDKEINDLTYRKQNLIRALDRKEISQEEYNEKYPKVISEIESIMRQLHNEQKQEKIKQETQEENKMPEEKLDKLKKPGKQASTNSYTGLILKALQMKSIKDVDAAVEKVNEWKPGRELAKIKTQTKTIIGLVKKQSPARWTKYSWDEEAFLLTDKEE